VKFGISPSQNFGPI